MSVRFSIIIDKFSNVNSGDNMIDVLFFIIGTVSIIGSIISFVNTKKYLSNSRVIIGIVTGIKEGEMDGHSIDYPIVEYTDEDTSERCIYESNVGSNFSSYKIGNIVRLRYCKYKEKKKVYINTWFDIWVSTFFSFMMGILAFFFSMIL